MTPACGLFQVVYLCMSTPTVVVTCYDETNIIVQYMCYRYECTRCMKLFISCLFSSICKLNRLCVRTVHL